MNSRQIEISVGVFVALGLISLLVLAMKVSNLTDLSSEKGYRVYAQFDNVGGLNCVLR